MKLPDYISTRIATLKRLCGLHVTCHDKGGVYYFTFGPPNRPLKTVCTYKKARMFAAGVAFGRQHLPLLDDWADGKPDAWDYEAVLRDHDVTVEWGDKSVDSEGHLMPLHPSLCGWGFSWKHGAIHIGQTTETIARKAAALFVSLWLRKVSASFCDKLMDGFIVYLERQEQTSLTLPVEIERAGGSTVTGLWVGRGPGRRCLNLSTTHQKIIEALDPQEDDEIVVTFTKRKKS